MFIIYIRYLIFIVTTFFVNLIIGTNRRDRTFYGSNFILDQIGTNYITNEKHIHSHVYIIYYPIENTKFAHVVLIIYMTNNTARDMTTQVKHFQNRNSLLFHNISVWINKDDCDVFDVTMSTFDGAEVGIYCSLYK